MKKHLTSILLLLLPAVLIIYAPQAVRGASAGLVLWFNQVLPVLFPFALILQLIMSVNALSGISCLTAPIMQKCLHLSPACSFCLLAGFLCGFPMGAKTTADLYQSNKISKQEACYLLTFSAFPSPSFLTGYLSFSILENQVPNHLLFFIFFLSAFLTSLFFRRIYSVSQQSVFTRTQKETSSSPFAELLDISIMNSLFSITKLGGYIILFSVFQGILQFLLSSSSFFSVILCGLTEFSTGLNALKDTALPFSLKFPLTMGFSNFGGLCVLAQTSCVLSGTDLPLFPYLIGRIVCTLIASGLTFLFVILF